MNGCQGLCGLVCSMRDYWGVAPLANADVEVILIVNETSANGAAKPVDRDAWNKFVDETAGAWESEFVRPPQGEFEQREPFV